MLADHVTGTTITPIVIVKESDYERWLVKDATNLERDWANTPGFDGKEGNILPVFRSKGNINHYVAVTGDAFSPDNYKSIPTKLPPGAYIITTKLSKDEAEMAAIGWEDGTYNFDLHKTEKKNKPRILIIPKQADSTEVMYMAAAIGNTMGFINDPPNVMTTSHLQEASEAIAHLFAATVKKHDVQPETFPLLHAVGRAADEENRPQLAEFTWGNPDHPHITLVGKGIVQDNGGNALKPLASQVIMKKDMGGAAHALGLAALIMGAKLPVHLRCLLPIAKNVISENAFDNGDILKARNGTTIEVLNTDAEGRLVLADAFSYAAQTQTQKQDLVIDFATLTGAARMVAGASTPVVMGSSKEITRLLEDTGEAIGDRLQSVTLDFSKAALLKNGNADLVNSVSPDTLPSHITAALFLNEFLPETNDWLHIDQSAWNADKKQAAVQGLRATYKFLQNRYG